MSKSCCFTGHRILSGGETTTLETTLPDTVRCLVQAGYHHFYTGGALGFDTLAALAVLAVRQTQPIFLHLVLPCMGQERNWRSAQIETYEKIVRDANTVTYLSEHYQNGIMFVRNRTLVTGRDLCLCYLRQMRGGTGYTVRYAQKQGIPLKNLCPTGPVFS